MTDALFTEAPPRFLRPTLEDVRNVPLNGLVAASTFSGCGGSSLGLRMAGWQVPVAVEFIAAAAETYRLNQPHTHVIETDIRKVGHRDLDGHRPGVKGYDLLEGSPPCAAFTPGGNREGAWGVEQKYSDTVQRVDDLFWQFTRILEELQPRAFLAENVPGMLTGRALHDYTWQVRKSIRGYVVHAKVINAANYGVPQARRRLIFVGFRDDQPVDWSWPVPTTPVAHTLEQALLSVPGDDPDHAPFIEASSMERHAVGRTWHAWKNDTPFNKIPCAQCGEPLEEHDVTERLPGGKVNKALCKDGTRAKIVKDYAQLHVPSLQSPCPTITVMDHLTHGASVTHPLVCRKFTPGEAKAIMGFPSDFRLTGTREQRYERMGRAVAPPLYAALGRALAEALTREGP